MALPETASSVYGLPTLPEIPCLSMRGPTPWSNWVIRGRVLAGGYPATVDDEETARLLTTFLELGVNTFVCLQAEVSLHTPEAAWRSGEGLRPYIRDAQRLLMAARGARSARIPQQKLDFLHLPILDGGVTSDHALSCLADDCCNRILRGERLYIHCWGGHGRTGTLVATMLGRLYGLSCSAALRYTQAMHDSRRFPQGVRSPQTNVQVAQVRRLLPDPPASRGVAYPPPLVLLSDEILRPGVPSSPEVLAGLGISEEAGTEEEEGDAVAAAAAAPGEVASRPPPPPAPPLHGHAAPPANQQRKEAIRARHAGPAAVSAAAAGVPGKPKLALFDLTARAGPGDACNLIPPHLEHVDAWDLRPSKVTVDVPAGGGGGPACQQRQQHGAAADGSESDRLRSRVAGMIGMLGSRWPGAGR